MKIIIHGGNDQIGGNCVEIASETTRLIFDIGMPLDGLQFQSGELASIENRERLLRDGILPDVKGLYYWDEPTVDAVVISHSHMDHVGWASLVHPRVKLLMNSLTHRLILGRMDSLRGQGLTFSRIQYFSSGERIEVGDVVISPYAVDHSASDAYAFLIEGCGKTIVYTGDFRSHGRNGDLISDMLLKLPVSIDALVIEGTNLGKDIYRAKKEENLEQEITKHCKKTDGIVLGLTATQNIDRIISFYNAAITSGRTLVVDPYQAHILDIVSGEMQLPINKLQIRVIYTQRTSKALAESGNKKILYRYKNLKISKDEMYENPNKYLFLVRGSMIKDLKALKLDSSSSFIYSLWQGYKASGDISRLLAICTIYKIPVIDLHTSGHADSDTLQQLIQCIKPRKIIPIHTLHGEEFLNFAPEVIKTQKSKPIVI